MAVILVMVMKHTNCAANLCLLNIPSVAVSDYGVWLQVIAILLLQLYLCLLNIPSVAVSDYGVWLQVIAILLF